MKRRCSLVLFACVTASTCSEKVIQSPSAPTPEAGFTQPSPPPSPVRRLRLLGENGAPELAFGEAELGQPKYMAFQLCNEDAAFYISDIRGPNGFQLFLDWEYLWDLGLPTRGCAPGLALFTPLTDGVHEGGIQVETVVPVEIEGRVSGTGIRPPTARTVFGEGRYLVNISIAPGRYFADPNGRCWWGRRADFMSPSDFIAERSSWFDPGQWIVDILRSDFQFMSEAGCGWWDQLPRIVRDRAAIEPGMWLVNRQIRPGRYRAAAAPGCHWERLRHFEGTPDGVISSGWTDVPGVLTVDIRSTDSGFLTSLECGQWRRES